MRPIVNTPLQGLDTVTSVTFGDIINSTSQDNVVAHASGGQANATQITAQQANVTTVANANDSVQLPPSAAGMEVALNNNTATQMNVFPFGKEKINALGASNAYGHAGNTVIIYYCYTAGQWFTK